MAFATITFKSKSGSIRKVAPVGFSWTTFFFGFFPALIRGDWKWALIQLVASLFTGFISWIVFCFIYNRLYIQGLIKEGFKAESYSGDKRMIEAKAQIKLR